MDQRYQPEFGDEKENEEKILKQKLSSLRPTQLELLEQQINKEIEKRQAPDWDLSELSDRELRELGDMVFLEVCRKKGNFRTRLTHFIVSKF
jgi:hypothetical protein